MGSLGIVPQDHRRGFLSHHHRRRIDRAASDLGAPETQQLSGIAPLRQIRFFLFTSSDCLARERHENHDDNCPPCLQPRSGRPGRLREHRPFRIRGRIAFLR
jgi:hypothetical protein